MRGHGLSPRNHDWKHNSVAAYARDDLPLIAAFVREQSGQAPHWVGHSLRDDPGGSAGRWFSACRAGGQRCAVRYPDQPRVLAVEGAAAGLGAKLLLKRWGRFPGRVSSVGRRMSRSAWPWRACAGMACSGALATNRATGGRGWPRWMCRCWPWLVRGLPGPGVGLPQAVRAIGR